MAGAEEEAPFVDYEGEEEEENDDENVAEEAELPSSLTAAVEPHKVATGAGDSETEGEDDGATNSDADDAEQGEVPEDKERGGKQNYGSSANKDAHSSRMDRALDAPRYQQPDVDETSAEANKVTASSQKQHPQSRGKHEQPSPREHVGAYIPPAKRRLLEQQQKEQQHTDDIPNKVTPIHIQRQTWETLQRTINGTINRLSVTTIKPLIHSLFQKANLIRGRGILVKSVLNGAMASPNYAHIYVALIAVINTKLPECGELLVTRAILAFRRGYQRRDRTVVRAKATLPA